MDPLVAQLDPARCTGCGRCIAACKPELFAFETVDWKKRAVLRDTHRCSGCRLCAWRCPTGALAMVDRKVEPVSPPVSDPTLDG